MPLANKDKETLTPLDHLRDLVHEDLDAIDEYIHTLIQSSVPLIPELANYTISSGGKRLRPLLTLACAKLCRYEDKAHIPLATAVEFIHTATLLHDDVVDGSLLRRGNPTANNKWGNKESILVGDFLFGKAFSLIGEAKSLEIYQSLSNASVVISEGEVWQLSSIGNIELTYDDYIQIITAKTAILFACACEVSALLSTKTHKYRQALYDFGLNLGIAFQIADDALDYSPSQQKLGKNIGDDFNERKITLPIITLLERANEKEKIFVDQTFKKGTLRNITLSDILELMQKYNIVDSCLEQSNTYVSRAQDALDSLPESSTRNILSELLHFIVHRNH